MKDVIFVVVDRCNKFVHFMPLAHPYTASKVAILFLQNVFKLHGLPSSIVSNRNPVFTSHFWQELMKSQGVQLAMSSAYHPPIDGQTEVVNKSLDHYLRAFATDRVDVHLKSRQQLTALLKHNLLAAQERMKLFIDKHRIEREFSVGDWVYLRLQP